MNHKPHTWSFIHTQQVAADEQRAAGAGTSAGEASETDIPALVAATSVDEASALRLFVFLARANGRTKDLVLDAGAIPQLVRLGCMNWIDLAHHARLGRASGWDYVWEVFYREFIFA